MLRKVTTVLASAGLACMLLPIGTMPALAQCEDVVADPSAEGVTNPAASISVSVRDTNFNIYQYSGNEQLSFPSAYDYYKDSHTIALKLTGQDPTKPCDDNIGAFSTGNTCTVQVTHIDNDADTVTVTPGDWAIKNGSGGPGKIRIVTSSGASVDVQVTTFTIPTEATVSESSLSLEPGQAKDLDCNCADSVWSSSDPDVATVNSAGLVTAIAPGTATISSTYDKYGLKLTASCSVTVKGKTAIGSSATIGKATYIVTGSNTATYAKCKSSAKKVTIPSTVTIKGNTFNVTKVQAGAFTKANAATVEVKSTKIASFKNAFKGSKVKAVKTPASKKAAYKKLLKASACGKKVTVK